MNWSEVNVSDSAIPRSSPYVPLQSSRTSWVASWGPSIAAYVISISCAYEPIGGVPFRFDSSTFDVPR